MNEQKLDLALASLAASKNYGLDTAALNIFRTNLIHLPYIQETLKEAISTKFFQDFGKTIDRMPTVAELIDLHKKIESRIESNKALITYARTLPKSERPILFNNLPQQQKQDIELLILREKEGNTLKLGSS